MYGYPQFIRVCSNDRYRSGRRNTVFRALKYRRRDGFACRRRRPCASFRRHRPLFSQTHHRPTASHPAFATASASHEPRQRRCAACVQCRHHGSTIATRTRTRTEWPADVDTRGKGQKGGSGDEGVGGNGPVAARARAMMSSRFVYGARQRGRDGSRAMT
jgi:hypothetical protein